MNVAIIGAGASGLYLGNLLTQFGIDFCIYEREGKLKDLGGGLDLWGNGVSMLQKLTYIPLQQLLHPIKYKVELNQSGSLHRQQNFSPFENFTHAPFLPIERYQLLRTLYHPIKDKVVFQSSIQDTTHLLQHHDCLVATDGAHSQVRQKLFPGDKGKNSYAGFFWGGGKLTFTPHHFKGKLIKATAPKKVLGIRPTSTGLYWFYLFKALEHLPIPKDLRRFFLEESAAWTPWFEEVVKNTSKENFFMVKTYDLDPLDSYGKENIFLLGDAAHLMTPLLGQNTSMGLEDAWVLANLLQKKSAYPEKMSFSNLQDKYFLKRSKRVTNVQLVDRSKVQSFFKSTQQDIEDNLENLSPDICQSMGYMADIILQQDI
jgi:FAD-dependent urate hydroxylase